MSTMALSILLLTARFIVGGVLLVAGVSKLRSTEPEVTNLVRAYGLVPDRTATWIARVLPPLEVASGLFLAIGLFTVPAALLSLGLMVLVTGAAGSALVRGRKVSCGCFGSGLSSVVSWPVVARNSVLIAALVAVVLWPIAPAADALPAAARLTLAALVLFGVTAGVVRARRRAARSTPGGSTGLALATPAVVGNE